MAALLGHVGRTQFLAYSRVEYDHKSARKAISVSYYLKEKISTTCDVINKEKKEIKARRTASI